MSSPADSRNFIVERLVGETGEPDRVIEAARALAERAVPAVLASLNDALASPINIDVGSVEIARMAKARPQGPTNHAMTVAPSDSSPDAMIMLIDADAIAIVIDALFGGDPDLPFMPITRSLSPTETSVAGMVFNKLAEAVNGSGTRAFNIRFPLPPAITGTEMAKHIVRDGPAVRIDFKIFTGGGSGSLSLVMPQRVLLKHRGDTVPAKNDEHGATWGQRLGEEVMRSAVRLEATMPLPKMTLGEITALRAGQVIAIDPAAQSRALLSARKQTLFVCEFGKLGQNYTVRVRHAYDAAQEFMDGLLPT